MKQIFVSSWVWLFMGKANKFTLEVTDSRTVSGSCSLAVSSIMAPPKQMILDPSPLSSSGTHELPVALLRRLDGLGFHVKGIVGVGLRAKFPGGERWALSVGNEELLYICCDLQ